MASGDRVHDIQLEPPRRRTGPLPVGVEFSADGKKVYTLSHAFRTWNRETGEKREEVSLGVNRAKAEPAYYYGYALRRSPDDKRMAVMIGDLPIRVYRFAD